MNRLQSYRAFFIPPDVDPHHAVRLGVEWLVQQPGEPLILLHAKKMVENNPSLSRAAREHHIRYEGPRTIWKSGRWRGGAVLAPWASPDVLRCIDDEFGREVTAVCVIGWRPDDPNHRAWTAARNAMDLSTGESLGKRADNIVSDPVVRVALDHAETYVNHNNALVQPEDKAYLVRTLVELVRGGHAFDLEDVAAYAMATGWTALEVKRIKEYGRRVLDRRSFRLDPGVGPKAGDCKRWEAEASGAKKA